MSDLISPAAVPEDIKYNLRPSMVSSNRLRSVVYPSNKGSSYSPSSVVVFNIPNLANSYLLGQECYLKKTVAYTTTGAATIYVDNNAQSFIQKIEIFSSDGTLLESINNYHSLASCIADSAFTLADRTSLLSNFWGFEDVSGAVADIRQGQSITCNTTTKYYTYAYPILSALFAWADKPIPVHKLAGEIRIEITLSDNGTPIYESTGVTTWVLSDIQLIAEYLQIHDSALLHSITPSTVAIHANSFRTFTNTITTSITSGTYNTLQVAFRGSSAKGVLFAPRKNATSALTNYTVGSRVAIAGNYQLNVGGQLYPSKPLQVTSIANGANSIYGSTAGYSFAEYAIELAKFWTCLTDTVSYNGSLSQTYYGAYTGSSGNTYSATDYKNGHLMAINLESVDRKSNRIMSGLDLRSALSFLQYTQIYTPDATITLDSFVLYDLILVIDENGRLMSRY